MSATSNRSRPVRVLYMARAPFISGAERALMSMLRHLDRSQIEPALVLGNPSELVGQAQAMGIPVTIAPLPKRSRYHMLAWWRSLHRLRRVIHDYRPDLIHANDVPSCQAMSQVAGPMGIPRVVHIRWVITATSTAWWARRGVEQIICISQWVREQLGEVTGTTLESARVDVIPDSVDWPATTPDQPPSPGAWSGDPTLGFAGQLIESKGLDLVIEAIGRMPKPRQPRLIVAGEDLQTGGAYQKHLERLANRCGVADRITWLGFLQDVSGLYRQVHAMVCPSRIEPLGLVPLEAARFNLPTLANRVGGLAETIVDDTTGYLVEPTAELWTGALDRVWDTHKLAQMGAAAHDRTRRLYSPGVYQERLLGVYHQLMDNLCEPPKAGVRPS